MGLVCQAGGQPTHDNLTRQTHVESTHMELARGKRHNYNLLDTHASSESNGQGAQDIIQNSLRMA